MGDGGGDCVFKEKKGKIGEREGGVGDIGFAVHVRDPPKKKHQNPTKQDLTRFGQQDFPSGFLFQLQVKQINASKLN